jgi:transcriptional regulator with XRE-family HTH domain
MKKTTASARKNVLGRRIRALRLRCRPPVSQDDLAGRLAAQGVTLDRSAISRIENEERYLMDYELIAIATCLKVAPAALFDSQR